MSDLPPLFFLFGCDHYYPSGGWNDFIAAHATVEVLKLEAAGSHCDFYQIVNVRLMKVVEEGELEESHPPRRGVPAKRRMTWKVAT